MIETVTPRLERRPVSRDVRADEVPKPLIGRGCGY
jgi:hypothetical protein